MTYSYNATQHMEPIGPLVMYPVFMSLNKGLIRHLSAGLVPGSHGY